MKQFLINHDKTRLLIFFSGFYTDYNSFMEFDNKTSDILFIYDYSDLNFEEISYFDFTPYTEINLIAYSYGVFASNLAYRYLPQIQKSCAISGTIYPIDENFGIKPKVFDIMLNAFSSDVVENFKSKMELNSLGTIKKADRTIENLKNELETIKNYILCHKIEKNFDFDSVIVTKKDKIVPFSAQKNYWQYHKNILEVDLGHFPFFYFENFDKILEI